MEDSKLEDLLQFRRMITPVIITGLFFLGILGVVIGGVQLIEQEGVASGLGVILFGILGVRLIAELLIIIFRINETLTDIHDQLVQNNRLLEHRSSVNTSAGRDDVAGRDM